MAFEIPIHFSLLFNLKLGASQPSKNIDNEDLEAQFYPWRAGTTSTTPPISARSFQGPLS
jgi:hypothetical protein